MFSNRIKELNKNYCLQDVSPKKFNDLIGGEMKHHKSSEPYFWETAYNMFLPSVIQIDGNGIAMNIFKLAENVSTNTKTIKYWSCSEKCNIRITSIHACLEFFKKLGESDVKYVMQLFEQIDQCHEKGNFDLQGHSIQCHHGDTCPCHHGDTCPSI